MPPPESTTDDQLLHVMFDADGVIQDIPGGWHAAMRPFLGERTDDFLHRAWADELPALTDEIDYLPVLERALRDYQVEVTVDEVFAAVWRRIEVNDESLRIVAAVRDAGYGVHLGTNQDRYRGEFMRESLDYGARFDMHLYSYELHVAKPDPEFFFEAARRIGAKPDSILFIDDNIRNVDGAIEAGLRAERWQISDGHDRLRATLRSHGIKVPAG